MRAAISSTATVAAAVLIGLTVAGAGGGYGLAQQGTTGNDADKADVSVPAKVRRLMQDRQYAEAVKSIDELLKKEPANAAYLWYLKGRAQYLGKQYREALESFAAVERRYGDSPWVLRARFGRAAVLLKTGDFEAAEQIYEQEVRFLLSTERKDQIAGIYLEFADAYYRPSAAAGPEQGHALQSRKPDLKKALTFYRKALEIGPSQRKRVRIEFRIARCLQGVGKNKEAAAAYDQFLKQHPKSRYDVEARFQLGAVQLALGQAAAARKSWKDLLADYPDGKAEGQLTDPPGSEQGPAAEGEAGGPQAQPAAAPAAGPHQKPGARRPVTAADRLAEAAYRIAHTYGLPSPRSVRDLELGVAAALQFIAAHPNHRLAPQAAYEVAQAYVTHRRYDEAVRVLQELIGNPKYAEARALPDARVLLGFALQRQGKFAEAIAAWRDYLTRHPAHSAWSKVQQAIIDTEFAVALEARRHKQFDKARKLWQTFLNKYPLDRRAPAILLEFGLMNFEQKRYAQAISDWQRLVAKYPRTESASRAQYLIGVTYEEHLNRFEDALAAYRKLDWGRWAPHARQRIERLTRQELTVITERVFRTNQEPRIKLITRNIRQLTIKAYWIDLESYFRKMHLATGIEGLDIALIDPDRTWTFAVPDYADYKQIVSYVPVPLTEPGVMAVTVVNEPVPLGQVSRYSHLKLRPQEATTMVVRSDLDILVRCSRNELFVFTENMRTGKPWPGVRLLVSDGKRVFAEGTTGKDGVFIGSVSEADRSWDPLKKSNDVRVFAVRETKAQDGGGKPAGPEKAGRAGDSKPPQPTAHVASSRLSLKGVKFAQGLSARGYVYTDRPAYRPGQLVHVRGIIRWVKGDQYVFEPGKKFRLDVYDSRGRQIRSEEVTLGKFGTFAARFILPDGAAAGQYRIHVHDPAAPKRHNYQGTFQVRQFQLQPVYLAVESPRKVYYRGERISGTIRLEYYYGAPLVNTELRYTLPDGTIHTARTDRQGRVKFQFETRQFSEDQVLRVKAECPERNLSAGLQLFLSTRGFRATVATAREVYIADETFDVTVTTTDAAGQKISKKMTLAVVEQTEVQGQLGERTVQEHPVVTDKESGQGRATIKIAKAGRYLLRATGTDRFGNPVSAQRRITVSGDDDTVRLRILADRHHYRAGDVAPVKLHWRNDPALAVVTYQGARVLGYRLVRLAKGTNRLEVPMSEKLAPNFDLVVSVMADSGGRPARPQRPAGEAEPQAARPPYPLPSFHQASSPFEVERPMRVEIEAGQKRLQPGAELTVTVTTTDPQGRPVPAELSLAMVEKSLLRAFAVPLSPVDRFFAGARRRSALRTATSCTFRYAPSSRPISRTLIAEAERRAIEELEALSRRRLATAVPPPTRRAPRVAREEAPAELESLVGELADRGLIPSNAAAAGRYQPNLSSMMSASQRGVGSGLDQLGAYLSPAPQSEGQGGGIGGAGFGRPASQRPAGQPRADSQVQVEMRQHLRRLGRLGRAQQAEQIADLAAVQPPAVEYPDAAAWAQMAARRKSWAYLQLDAQRLRQYAAAVQRWSGGGPQPARPAQLNLLLLDGTAQFVNAADVAAGKLPGQQGAAVLDEFQVRETAYWNPHIVTDQKGRATVHFTVPDRSTAWQLTARGITAGTLSGQTETEVTARKDFFAELKLPASFVEGDTAQILATIHNDAVDQGTITATLTTRLGDRQQRQSQTIKVAGRGTQQALFQRQMPMPGEAVFELTVTAGPKHTDVVRAVVPVRPFGMPVATTVGGSASSNLTAWIAPPQGMVVRSPSLQITIGGSVQRSLLDTVLRPGLGTRRYGCFTLRSPIEHTTSQLLASLALLEWLRASQQAGSPEAAGLADRARSAIGYLVASQNKDGGWSWPGPGSRPRGAKRASDPRASARALWALTAARQAGFSVPEKAWAQAVSYVRNAFSAARQNDFDTKATLLHALTVAGRGDFGYANRLYRSRPSLRPAAIAYLGLTFVEMGRQALAAEVLELLAGKPGQPAGRPATAADAEVTALLLLGLQAAVGADDPRIEPAAQRLLAARTGSGWFPERATGPAVMALARYFAQRPFQSDRYKLTVFVNDEQVAELAIDPSTGTQVVEVPADLLKRGQALPGQTDPAARKQRINFELTGRGRFTYSAVFTGFVTGDQLKSTTKDWRVERYYEPAPLEFDGRQIPRGFGILSGSYRSWRNTVTQLPAGRHAQVHIYVYRWPADTVPTDQLDYLVVTEPLPAGTSVLEESIRGQFDRYELAPGSITFYVGQHRGTSIIHFDLLGYVPGQYRASPTVVRSYYEPERMAVANLHPLKVLPAGKQSADKYRLTPVELYELGKRKMALAKKRSGKPAGGGAPAAKAPAGEAAADRAAAAPGPPANALFDQARQHLAELFDNFQLKTDVHRRVVQMLLELSLRAAEPRQTVRYFEVIKEKYPDMEVPFDQIVGVAAAYRDLGEYERSYLVFRATAEASFVRESQVPGFLLGQGQFRRSVAVMDRLLRQYPAEPYVAAATYALAQQVLAYADKAASDPQLRAEKLTRLDLLREGIDRLDHFLTLWPQDPAADQASFSLASALVELEAWAEAIERCHRFASRFPKSSYLDGFWYIMGYSHFARGEHRPALELCRRVAEHARLDPRTGRELESPNKWQAIYIMGQVHHARGEAAEAIRQYLRVKDRFADAREAIEYFTRKALEMPEITTVPPGQPVELALQYRNIADCQVKAYRIDLMKFSLLRRDLSNVARINLAGIRALAEQTLHLGDGHDYRDKTRKLRLPVDKPGAYLVVCRGGDLHTSGLVLVTPLKLDVQEERSSGRVRVTVRDTQQNRYAAQVKVKVIGTRNRRFRQGRTDLRGIFVADGLRGRSTVIARAGDGQYAFYRGQVELGPPPRPTPAKAAGEKKQTAEAKPPAQAAKAPAAAPAQPPTNELLRNLYESNRAIQRQQGQALDKLFKTKQKGVQAQQAF